MTAELENALEAILRPDFGRSSAAARPARISPKAALASYLEHVYPARRHGATEAQAADGGALSDADHMLQWLAERGLAVVNVKRGPGS